MDTLTGIPGLDSAILASAKESGARAGAHDYTERAADVAFGSEAPTWAWPRDDADEALINAVGGGVIAIEFTPPGIDPDLAWKFARDVWCSAFNAAYDAAHAEATRGELVTPVTDEQKCWRPIDRASIPAGIRFDVPRRFQGQIVEHAFGDYGRYEHDDDSPYMQVTDRSLPASDPKRVLYFKRAS